MCFSDTPSRQEGTSTMHTFLESHRQTKSGLASTVLSGIFILGLALASPAAGMGAGGGGGGSGAGAGGSGGGAGAGAGGSGGGAGAGAGRGGAGAGGGGGGGAGGGGGTVHPLDQSGLTTCLPAWSGIRSIKSALSGTAACCPTPN